MRQLVIDREGMAAELLARLAEDGCDMVTVLRADQYVNPASFTDVGIFVPFQYHRDGTLVPEVAPARFSLARPDPSGERLDLCVALMHDLRARPRPAAVAEPARPLCMAGGSRPGG